MTFYLPVGRHFYLAEIFKNGTFLFVAGRDIVGR